jgi:cytochrome b
MIPDAPLTALQMLAFWFVVSFLVVGGLCAARYATRSSDE